MISSEQFNQFVLQWSVPHGRTEAEFREALRRLLHSASIKPSQVKHDYRKYRTVGVAADTDKSEQKTVLALLLEDVAAKADDLDLFVSGITLGNQLRSVIGAFQRTGDVSIPE